MGRSLQGKSITPLISEQGRSQSSPISTPSKPLYIQPIAKASSLCPCDIIENQLLVSGFLKALVPELSWINEILSVLNIS